MSAFPHKQLRFLFSVSSGATPESGNSAFWDGDIFWATPEDVSGGSKTLSSTRRMITIEGFESCSAKMAPPGTIVLTKRAPIGQLAISEVELCCNQGCFLLEPTPDADNEFFYYWLTVQTGYLQVLGRGSTFMELSSDEIKAVHAPCIPIARQRQISSFLNRETEDIDALIAAKQRLLDLMAEKRRAIVAEAVMRGPDPSAPLRPSGIDWLGDIPSHWEVRRVATLFSQRDERNQPDLPLLEVSINAGVVVRQFSSDKIEATAADFNTYKVARSGDIAFNKMRMWQGAVGVAPVDGLVSPDYTVAKANAELLPEYAGQLFRTASFSAECGRNSQGITWDRLRLYWDGFRDIFVPVPPLDEQQQIVEYINAETAKIDRLRAAIESSITLLKERRAALIAAAVTGQIEVPEAA